MSFPGERIINQFHPLNLDFGKQRKFLLACCTSTILGGRPCRNDVLEK